MESQSCSVCKESKPLEQFHKNKNRKNGRSVTCKPCAINRSRIWEKNNPEKVKENSRILYHRDLEKSRKNRQIRVKKWVEKYPEKMVAAQKAYRLKNPEAKRISEQKRRANKLGNGVFKISQKEILNIIRSSCVACGSYDKITMDHIIPLSRGGRHSIGNLQPLCFSCNASKSNRFMTEWALSKGGNQNFTLGRA